MSTLFYKISKSVKLKRENLTLQQKQQQQMDMSKK